MMVKTLEIMSQSPIAKLFNFGLGYVSLFWLKLTQGIHPTILARTSRHTLYKRKDRRRQGRPTKDGTVSSQVTETGLELDPWFVCNNVTNLRTFGIHKQFKCVRYRETSVNYFLECSRRKTGPSHRWSINTGLWTTAKYDYWDLLF
jgi:hypothetical protein